MLALLLAGCDLLTGHYGAPKDPADPSLVVVEVPQGSTIRAMAPVLEDAGVISDADGFTTWVRITKEGGCIKAGRHKVGPAMGAHELVEALCGVPLPEDVPFTVVEGWRIREIDAALVEAGLAQPGEYAAAAAQPGRFTASYSLPTELRCVSGVSRPEPAAVTSRIPSHAPKPCAQAQGNRPAAHRR